MCGKNWLVPGGLGFIGSHTVVEIIQRTEANVIIADNFSNCFDDVLERIFEILEQKKSKEQLKSRIEFHKINIMNINELDQLFKEKMESGKPIDGIMHFAAKKAIGESMNFPIMYYENNIGGTLNLVKMMQKYECHNFIFSSTAGVYGDKDNCTEEDELRPVSPYGQSKMAVELLLASLARCHPKWRIISLRYFNPCGGHESGLLGDQPFTYPNNLFPFIQQVLTGKREKLVVFGNDYATPDGTCIRDYIHIFDLAVAHVQAMQKLSELQKPYEVYNLGSGCGYSVLEILGSYEKVLGKKVNFSIGDRRSGDVAKLLADPKKANKQLNWKVTKNLEQMCRDSVRFIFKRFKIESQQGQENII